MTLYPPAPYLRWMEKRKAPSYAAAVSTQISTYKMVSVPTSFDNWEDANQAQSIFSVWTKISSDW